MIFISVAVFAFLASLLVAIGLARNETARHEDRSPALDLKRPLAWPVLAALLLALILFAPAGRSPFIYLQF
jgi:hypothetical protein